MHNVHFKKMYQIISFLLQYPTEEMKQSFSDIRETVEEMNYLQLYDHVDRFLTVIESVPFAEWEQHYIDYFDFGKKTNLYVTYYEFGEERERGLSLLKLKEFYNKAGFTIAENELPDYLPAMLELAANMDETDRKTFFQTYVEAIKQIREGLVEEGSFYMLLFDALFIVFELDIFVKVS